MFIKYREKFVYLRRFPLMAYAILIFGQYLAISSATAPICFASSVVGKRQIAYRVNINKVRVNMEYVM